MHAFVLKYALFKGKRKAGWPLDQPASSICHPRLDRGSFITARQRPWTLLPEK